MHKITDVIDADTAQLIAEEWATPSSASPNPTSRRPVRHARRSRRPRVASAGRHHHGPRRPRQDLAARRHPQDQRRLRRGRRHHPAHRRLSGDAPERPEDHLHRHARPRRVHRHARPRRQGDRHRGAGGRRRRRRHAADDRGDQPRQGGRTCRSSSRSTRSTSRTPTRQRVRTELLQHEVRSNRWAATCSTSRSRRSRAPTSTSCSRPILLQAEVLDLKANPDAPPKAPSSRPSSTAAAARSRPCWSSAARSRRRHHRRRLRMGPRARADRRSRRAGQGSRPVDAGRGARLQRRAGGRRPLRGRRIRGPRPRDHRIPQRQKRARRSRAVGRAARSSR
jgi:hypothetical protein